MKHIILIISVVGLLLLPACRSKFQKALKSPDNKQKLELAEYYYKKKDFYRAQVLFEQLEEVYSGTSMAEKILYFNAQCNYGLKSYQIAGFQFKTYYESYPTGMYAEECLYLNAYCSYLESQEYELDQTDTYKAIETLKLFINVYPDSKFVSECNVLIDRLRYKLSYKAYKTAKLYFDIGEYKSSIVALKNVGHDFPEVAQKEEIDFLVVKSYYLLAVNSVPEKQKQRFTDTIDAFYEYADLYTESSKFFNEAKAIKAKAEQALKKLENNKS